MSTSIHDIPKQTGLVSQAVEGTPDLPLHAHAEDGSLRSDPSATATPPHLQKRTSSLSDGEKINHPHRRREDNYRLGDDLELLRAERVASRVSESTVDLTRSRSGRKRAKSRAADTIDDFDLSANPVHDTGKGVWRPPERPATKVAKVLKAVNAKPVQNLHLQLPTNNGKGA